jgi:hypothetical protein
MFKVIISFFILLWAFLTYPNLALAQTKGGVGIKAGLNYNANGNYFKDAQLIWEDPLASLGYHVGGFAKGNLGIIYIRPELVYSQLKTTVQNESYLTKRLDAPILIGTSFLGSLITVFAGPSFHYRINDDLLAINWKDVDNNFNTGFQFGLGLNLGPIGLDLRYEKELAGRELSINNAVFGNLILSSAKWYWHYHLKL